MHHFFNTRPFCVWIILLLQTLKLNFCHCSSCKTKMNATMMFCDKCTTNFVFVFNWMSIIKLFLCGFGQWILLQMLLSQKYTSLQELCKKINNLFLHLICWDFVAWMNEVQKSNMMLLNENTIQISFPWAFFFLPSSFSFNWAHAFGYINQIILICLGDSGCCRNRFVVKDEIGCIFDFWNQKLNLKFRSSSHEKIINVNFTCTVGTMWKVQLP